MRDLVESLGKVHSRLINIRFNCSHWTPVFGYPEYTNRFSERDTVFNQKGTVDSIIINCLWKTPLIIQFVICRRKQSQACFKRRATAVLSWLDCCSTAAPNTSTTWFQTSNLIHTMTVEWNGCCQKQNTKIKKRFSKLSNETLSLAARPHALKLALLTFKNLWEVDL